MKTVPIHTEFEQPIGVLAKALKLSDEQAREAVLRAYRFYTPEQDGRVAGFLAKAAAGEALTVVGLGGSITAGALANENDENASAYTDALGGASCWFDRTIAWLRKQYPTATFRAENAGIGATPSFLGAFRLEQMVLQHKPDLVFVEFSVNDASAPANLLENEIHEAYESVIRRCLEAGVAVIALFMNQASNSGYERYHSQITNHYNVPGISYHSATYPNGEKLCDWTLLSPDGTHPNNLGHALAATCICNYLENVRTSNATPAETTIPDEWVYADTFHHVWMQYAWQLQDRAEGAISLKLDAKPGPKWKGTLVSEGESTVRATVPKGAKRVWVLFCYNNGSFEVSFNGQQNVCHTAPVGWPRPMWFRVHTGAPLEQDSELVIRTRKNGSVLLIGVMASF